MKALSCVILTAALPGLFASEISAFVRLPTSRRQEVLLRRKPVSPWQEPAVLSPTSSNRLALRPLQVKKASQQDNKASQQDNDSASSILVKLASSPVGALIVVLGVVLFHESGHYLTARALGVHPEEFSIGVGPRLLGLQAFGDEFNLRAFPIGGYVRFSPAVLLPLAWQQRVLIASAGIIFNLLLAYTIYIGQILFAEGIPQLVFDQGVLVSGIAGRDAAASGILRQGDVIVQVNGAPVTMSSLQSPTEAEAQRAISQVIDIIQATPNDESLQLSIRRGKSSKLINVTIMPKRTAPTGPQTIGVFLEPNFVGVELLQSDTFLEAAGLASTYVFALTKETAIGLVTFVKDFFSKKAGSSEYGVKGPVGVIQTASEVVATQDWNTVLKYAAAISINLGVVNAFPIPPSDGFQIAFVLVDALWSSRL